MNAHSIFPRLHSDLLILGLILLLAAILRFFSLSALGFWTDEFSALCAADANGLQLVSIPLNQLIPPTPCRTRLAEAKPFWQIPSAMARDDAHPPLYFMLLRLWEDLFGDSESAVRSLNVILSLLAIVLLYFAARQSIGSSAALVACLLMAVATPQIQYAQEARNYMLPIVFALIAFIAIGRLQRAARLPAATVLAICMLAMMLTHYLAAGVAVGLGVHAMLSLKKTSRFFALIGIALAAIAFLILWGPAVLKQQSVMHTGLAWLNDSQTGHLKRRSIDLCRLPVRFFCEITDPRPQMFVAVFGAALLLAIPVLFIRRSELRPWIYWLVAGIGIVVAADLWRSTTQLNWVRYSLLATPAAYVLLAGALRGRWRFALPGFAVFLGLACLGMAYIPPWKIDFRTPVQIIDNLKGPADGLIISGPDRSADEIMFAAFQHYCRQMPATVAVLTSPPTGPTLDRLRQCPQVWIVWIGSGRPTIPGFEIHQERQWPSVDLVQGIFKVPATSQRTTPNR